MPLEAGIVGLPNVGKSTLFNALAAAGAEASNYPFCTIEPNIGVVSVPDPRLEQIHQFIETKEVIHATLRLADIAGLVKGASEGEGLGNKFLAQIRDVDAILHIARCFEDPDVTHVDGSVDPIRDIEVIETELLLSDLQVIEGAVDRAQRQARTGEPDAKARVALLERCQQAVEAGRPVRSIDFGPEDALQLKGIGLITAKRVLYIANVDEADAATDCPHLQAVRQHAEATGGRVEAVSARIESELMELDLDDRDEMLESVGLTEPALAKVARATYQLLGLQSFFTAGPEAIRAWPIPIGATALEAAGQIHTDMQRGFIKAEVYNVDDLIELKSEAAIKAAGRMRMEGKSYVMHNSDLAFFHFNV